MAKPKKSKKRAPIPKIEPQTFASMPLPRVRVELAPVSGALPFRYTSPSVRLKRSMAERRAAGCRFTKGKLDPRDAAREECQAQSSPPCATSRKSCPVQLVFDKGTPALRFCFEKGQKGHAHRFTDVEAAARFAEEACKCWSKTGSFEKCREYFSEGLIGVGGAKRKKRAPKRRDAIVVAAQRRKAGAHTDKRKRRGKHERAWRDEE